MPEEIVKIVQFICARCGHRWSPRKGCKPVCCPKCKSPYWDRIKDGD